MTELLDPSAALAVLDANKVVFSTMLCAVPHVERHGDDGLWWVDSHLADSEFNGAYMVPDSGDEHEYAAAAATVVSYFRRVGRPFHWQIGLRPEPVDAREILLGNGLRWVEDEPAMWLNLATVAGSPLSAEGLEVRPVVDDPSVRVWMRVWGGGAPAEVTDRWYSVYRQLPYGPDANLRMFVGYLDGVPVATSYLFLTGSVCSVNYVVTDERCRRRGIGAAMTDAAIRHARAAGCRIAVLTASPYGIGIYRRLGFRECGVVGTYEWKPPSVR